MQSVAPVWLKVAPAHEVVLWHREHCPAKWFGGRSGVWQERQSVAPVWLKVAFAHVFVLWHREHCPAKWFGGLSGV